MDTVRIDLSGDRRAGLRFEEFPDALYEELTQEIGALSRELFSRVEAATPSRTGALRSQERLRLFTDKNRITGYVDIASDKGGDFAKAGALEYGAHKRTSVKPHARKLNHVFERALAAPMDVIVGAYDRTPNIAEHAFERGPLGAMRGEIVQRLNAVVEKAVAGANA